MNNEQIIATSFKLKEKGKVYSNCYTNFNKIENREWKTVLTEKTLLIVAPEYKVNRLWFYSTEPKVLKDAVTRLTKGEYVLDIVTKDPQQYKDALEGAGFERIATMLRMSAKDISPALNEGSPLTPLYNKAIVKHAVKDDADDIYETLWTIFDTRISHLPDKTELSDLIEKNEITICRESGKLVSLLQAKVEPKSFYINQVFNLGKKENVHSLMLERLEEYVVGGGKYAFAWVEESNIPSIKFHEKYGLKHDGLFTVVYSVKL